MAPCAHVAVGAEVRARVLMAGAQHDGTELTLELHVCARCVLPLLDMAAPKINAATEVTLSFDGAPC